MSIANNHPVPSRKSGGRLVTAGQLGLYGFCRRYRDALPLVMKCTCFALLFFALHYLYLLFFTLLYLPLALKYTHCNICITHSAHIH